MSPCLLASCGSMGRMQGPKHVRHVILPTESHPDTCVFCVRNHRLKPPALRVLSPTPSLQGRAVLTLPSEKVIGQLSPFYRRVGSLQGLAYKLGCYFPDSEGQGCEVGCERSGLMDPL